MNALHGEQWEKDMSTDKSRKSGPAKKVSSRPLKPQHPLTEGAPNDQDPKAQYEDKDES